MLTMLSLRASGMTRQPLVLLVTRDRLTGLLTKGSLQGYGYDVLTAGSVDEARALLLTNSRSSILVIYVELENTSAGLVLAKVARTADPTVRVVYTCSAPYR